MMIIIILMIMMMFIGAELPQGRPGRQREAEDLAGQAGPSKRRPDLPVAPADPRASLPRGRGQARRRRRLRLLRHS